MGSGTIVEYTCALLQRAYYWPQRRDDIASYVKTYLVHQLDVADHQKKTGLLEPSSISNRSVDSGSMDYIDGLLRVGDFGTIIVGVDHLSKDETFTTTPKYISAEEIAQLFFKYIVKYWGPLIINDRDSRFTGTFWTELFKLIGSTLNMNSSFHPQSDG